MTTEKERGGVIALLRAAHAEFGTARLIGEALVLPVTFILVLFVPMVVF